MIIDVHTHIFPPKARENREKYLALDAWFNTLYSHPKAKLASAEDLVASMEAAQIDRSVALGFAWRDQARCRESNDYILESMARYPNRLIGFAAVQPLAGREAVKELERCFAAGMAGVGELNGEGQDFSLNDEGVMAPIVEVLQAHDKPLMIHTSEPVGHLYPGKGFTTPDLVYRLVHRFPDLKLICAHWGGGLPFYTLMPEVAAATRNVYYDTGASTYLYHFDIFQVVIQLVGADHILMGTDYPVLSQAKFLQRLRSLNLPQDDLAKILGENADRLLNSSPR